MPNILRDAGLSELVEGDVEEVASGFDFTEGPLWLPDGSVLFQDVKAEKSYRLDPDGNVSLLRSDTGAANGQTFAADGSIVFCEQTGRRFSRMNADGTGVETLAETYQGRRLNSPNDTICRSDGLIFFTDPPYGVPNPEAKELDFQGVFSLRLGDPEPSLVTADGLEKPNGLALSPDEEILYVNDTAHYHVRSYRLSPEGKVVEGPGSGEVLATFDPKEKGGPDGLKIDRDGRLYVAVAEGVWVLDPSGRLLGIIAVQKRPANLAWVGPDAKTLFLTATDTVYRVRLNVQGVLPPGTPGTSPSAST